MEHRNHFTVPMHSNNCHDNAFTGAEDSGWILPRVFFQEREAAAAIFCGVQCSPSLTFTSIFSLTDANN